MRIYEPHMPIKHCTVLLLDAINTRMSDTFEDTEAWRKVCHDVQILTSYAIVHNNADLEHRVISHIASMRVTVTHYNGDYPEESLLLHIRDILDMLGKLD